MKTLRMLWDFEFFVDRISLVIAWKEKSYRRILTHSVNCRNLVGTRAEKFSATIFAKRTLFLEAWKIRFAATAALWSNLPNVRVQELREALWRWHLLLSHSGETRIKKCMPNYHCNYAWRISCACEIHYFHTWCLKIPITAFIVLNSWLLQSTKSFLRI